ncbi:MAG: hypothetical protein E6K17_02730 [Methanobacteriota archaeon]|nr:MAG: hypothetical protein E6K17_02730 [Euryarchaeota archaeon]
MRIAEPVAPPVVLACLACGFDYTVTTVDVDGCRLGAVWTCSCGIRYIPPGGETSHRVVRP